MDKRLCDGCVTPGECDIPVRLAPFTCLTFRELTTLGHELAALPLETDVVFSYARAARTLLRAASGP